MPMEIFGVPEVPGDARRSRFGSFRLAAIASTALVSSLQPAFAQSTDAAPQAQTAAVEPGEIIVTAQKRSERLEEVPMAVAVVSSDALEKANVNNLHELGRITAGVQINFSGSSTQPSIRGVTSLTAGVGNENNVAIYVDGFYVSNSLAINTDLANLASIQVLKGPQGTLYGRNATGGAILINTLDPAAEFGGKLEGSYARFDERKLSGYVTGPITDGIRFMVAGALRNSDGHIRLSDPSDVSRTKGNAAPIRQRSVRTKLAIDLAPDLTATLAYNYADSLDGTSNLFTPFEYVAILPGGNQRATRFGTASYNPESDVSARTHEGTLKLEYVSPIGTITSYTGYARRKSRIAFDFDGTYADLTYGDSISHQKSFQQSVDFSVNAIDDIDLIVGGAYINDKYLPGRVIGSATNYSANRVVLNKVDRPLGTEAWAAYADATWHISDKLHVSAGGRYSHDKREVSQHTVDGSGATIVPYFEREATFKRFTPRAVVRYELSPRTNVYASYSKGFRSGSFNSNAAASAALSIPAQPEDIQAYEIGFKTAGRKFRFEVSGFYYDYTNLNVSLTVPSPLCAGQPICNPVTVVGNAPKATIYGIDGQVNVTPLDGLNVSLGGAWLHARYGTFTNAIGTGLDATNPAALVNKVGQVQDWTGQQMSRAPNFSGNLAVDYTFALADGNLRLSGNVAYSDSYVISNPSLYGALAPAGLSNRQRYRQGATAIINADVAWTAPGDRYWIGIFGKNLSNLSYRQTYNGGVFGDYSSKAPPVTYGVRAGVKF